MWFAVVAGARDLKWSKIPRKTPQDKTRKIVVGANFNNLDSIDHSGGKSEILFIHLTAFLEIGRARISLS